MQSLDLSKIGCSDLPALVGVDPYRSKHDLWMRLVHGTQRTSPPWLDDAATLGRYHERGTALAVLERQLGYPRDKLPELTQPPSRQLGDALRYSLDFVSGALLLDDTWVPTGERPRVIECKSRRWRSMKLWGPAGSSHVTPAIAAQVQGQLASIWRDRDWWLGTEIPDVDVADVCVSVDGSETRHYPVKRNLDLGLGLLEEAERFCAEYVDTATMPPVDERANDALDQLYPEAKDEVRDATEREAELFAAWRKLKDERRALDHKAAELEAELKFAIQDGAGLRLGPGQLLRWSEQKGRTRTAQVLTALVRDHGVSAALIETLKQENRGAPLRVLKESKR